MLKPLQKNILISVHKSGFTAMEQVDEREDRIEKATVIAIGEEVTLVKEGDVVYFKDYETDQITDGEDKYTLINEEAVKALYHE